FCLGGDTSFGADASFSCTALGRVPAGRKPTLRLGARAGDLLYTTGPLGSGNLLAISAQVNPDAWSKLEKVYRPVARLREARALSSLVHCSIDTSDALLQALAIIASLNQVGIEFEQRDELYDPDLRALSAAIKLPLWLVNVFGLGEYELVWSVDASREEAFLQKAQAERIPVNRIGRVSAAPGIRLQESNRVFTLDVPYLLNLFGTCPSIPDYLKTLITYDATLRSQK
nr:AIR synthase-related protein [Candidatus Ozemobacteraceae bacterium]